MADLSETSDHDSTAGVGRLTAVKIDLQAWDNFSLREVERDETTESPELSSSPDGRLSPSNARSPFKDDIKRDSGLAPSNHDSLTDVDSASSLRKSPSLPHFPSRQHPRSSLSPRTQARRWGLSKLRSQEPHSEEPPPVPQVPLVTLTTEIPTSSFEDLTSPNNIKFSNRGSMLIGGRKFSDTISKSETKPKVIGSRRKHSISMLSPGTTIPTRILSTDDQVLSNKVRSMYNGVVIKAGGLDVSADAVTQKSPMNASETAASTNGSDPSLTKLTQKSITNLSKDDKSNIRFETEAAGGIEDWENLNGDDVDRYGFIVPRKLPSRGSSGQHSQSATPEPQRIQRVSTALHLASEAPRRRRSKLQRNRSTRTLARSTTAGSDPRPLSRTNRPASSQSSYRGSLNGSPSTLRAATNRLTHNRSRRIVDEAGDMLTLPPGLADIAENEEDSKTTSDLKRKEFERDEKWRKMAKPVKKVRDGSGMAFEFDTKSPKLIERTWKGIPDRWRATAWHAFLTASAKKQPTSLSDEELIIIFNKLLEQGSPDDVQIDLDVPRTINSHIMFRKRYRGGQRLLFRVLHCLSIYFPDTGYVQGMAAITATLLCYFDEEMTFVMLVRLWQLRGLEPLYKSGFEGLMGALEEFKKGWLAGGEVSAKLEELGIDSTAYGTRWYLTLFNYSIPFPAQLRVWDVFMLLGDADYSIRPPTDGESSIKFHGGLDVLHATAAALIDGTRDILLDSDFENAMKVLTSWIPIKDEELLMQVAKAEWKVHRRKP